MGSRCRSFFYTEKNESDTICRVPRNIFGGQLVEMMSKKDEIMASFGGHSDPHKCLKIKSVKQSTVNFLASIKVFASYM